MASITEPERTARWFASWTWTGESGPGHTIRYRMVFEEGDQESEMTIDACEPPRHLAVSAADAYGGWRLEVRLSDQDDGTTRLTLHPPPRPTVDVTAVGPGWEYYLDNLVAAHDGTELPSFDDYYPAQKPYYESQG